MDRLKRIVLVTSVSGQLKKLLNTDTKNKEEVREMRNKKGFTLTELLIVVAIIGVLIAIALPRFQHATNVARSNADLANIRIINTAIELYSASTKMYPVPPNLGEMFNSTTYFPDGPPKCPWLNANTIGTYSIYTQAPYADEATTMRVTTRAHWLTTAGTHDNFVLP